MINDTLQKIDPKSLPLIYVGILLLTVAIIASYGLKPVIKEYYSLHQSKQTLESIVDEGQMLTKQILEMENEITKLKQSLYGEDGSLPLKQVEGFVIGKLQKISWDNKVELLSVRPNQTRSVLQFEEIPFEVEIQGNYTQLYNWLLDAGHDLGFVVVKRFDVNPRPITDANDKLSMKLTMVTYRTKER